jgi:hypothetical protein
MTQALRRARTAAVIITAGIGTASFVLSFAALRDLAARAGIPDQLAWLWPLIVDGAILQATMAVVVLAGYSDQRGSRRFFWAVLTCSAAVSVGANALHAVIPPDAVLNPWWSAGIAVVAPVSLLAATHGLSLLSRVGKQVDSTAPPAQAPALPDDEQDVAPVSQRSTAVVQVDVTDRGRWRLVAQAVASRGVADQLDDDEIAAMLFVSFEQQQRNRVIARQFEVDPQVVTAMVSAASELLASGEVSVERLESREVQYA